MSTLAKRATPRQAMVLRMVAGAVINAGHAHPEWGISPRMARSIAKRATGTLTAQWPDVLAAPEASSEPCARTATRPRVQLPSPARNGSVGGGAAGWKGRPSLRHIRYAIGAMAGEARRAGQKQRHAALVDVLRLLAGARRP